MHGATSDPKVTSIGPRLSIGGTNAICKERRLLMPEMIYVDSSNIEAIGYDDDAQELHVQFLCSAYYIYSGVPRFVFDDLMNAASKGSFLNR